MIHTGKLSHGVIGYQIIIKNAVTLILISANSIIHAVIKKLKVLPKSLSVRLKYFFFTNSDEFFTFFLYFLHSRYENSQNF